MSLISPVTFLTIFLFPHYLYSQTLNPVSVHIGEKGLPLLETFLPEIKNPFASTEPVCSDEGYEIEDPCIYEYVYSCNDDTGAFYFYRSNEWFDAPWNYSDFISADPVCVKTLSPDLAPQNNFLFNPLFCMMYSPPLDTTIQYSYVNSYYYNYSQPPCWEEKNVTITYKNGREQMIYMEERIATPEMNNKFIPVQTWIYDYAGDRLEHIEIIEHFDSSYYVDEEFPEEHYKTQIYFFYDVEGRLVEMIGRRGKNEKPSFIEREETEKRVRESVKKDEYGNTNYDAKSELHESFLSSYLKYSYSNNLLKDAIAYRSDYSVIAENKIEYDDRHRITRVTYSLDGYIHFAQEFSYEKKNVHVRSCRNITPQDGVYPAEKYLQDVKQYYSYDRKKRISGILTDYDPDYNSLEWSRFYYGN